jgi:hypothetical protein
MDKSTDKHPSGASIEATGTQAGNGKVHPPLGPSIDAPHLDPVIRPLLAGSDLTRAHHILKDLYISHPPIQRIERKIEHLLRMPRKTRMTGLFVCGDSGMGKTHLGRKIERSHAEYNDAKSGRTVVPVLFVSVPAGPSISSLRGTIMDAAYIPYVTSRYVRRSITPQSALLKSIKAAGTRLIVLDDIHNIEAARDIEPLRDYVRCLSNETQLPLLLLGMEKFENSLARDPQLSTRYPIVRLSRWMVGPDFAALLQAYERACPLRLASGLTDMQVMQALIKETGGLTEYVIQCLQTAALVAIREGTERITPDNCAWWRDAPLSSHYPDEEDDLEALAEAFLKDTGRSADPVFAPTPEKLPQRATLSSKGLL